MKKNLLFVIPSLSSGGGERSLVNLLTQIDYGKYEVDLFLLSHEGLFMEFVPEEVNLLPVPQSYRTFTLPLVLSVFKLLTQRQFALAFHRIMYSIRNRYAQKSSIREQYNWKHLSAAFGRLPKHYDAAAGFLEKTATYFCVEKVNAGKKIGWVHIDYDKLGMDPSFDIRYFGQLDSIVTVSEECAQILKKRFPNQAGKVHVIHNIVSPTVIRQMAGKGSPDVYRRRGDETVILSIGRLHEQKAFQLAIEACKKLVDSGYHIQWNIIGEGDERKKLTKMIREKGLERQFHLLGLKSNPYPYLKQADLYVQTSSFEGKSIAIDEAKIMAKPIIVTRFSTAKDQIDDGVDGLIVEMSADAIAAGIEQLIKDREFANKMTEHLSSQRLGTEEEIDKIYRLLG